ncbi:class I SAM-dependent methyltransferase [Paenibacillus agricola]|uniref:Class I SAM-dependent methyltransferase n=1 Tax=Paenibacillus agricola TaxID=2716264 RepID=A0ABX0J2F6_9BACL|nr:class I SAM-dependent methyltransferase [Paenibacillus agricola]NHN30449.1 class I SAM-dependent methyltransferase [Paenibacillus agricola]
MDNSNHNEVVLKFNQVAHEYDNQRRNLIPCFDDFYDVSVSIAETGNETPSILELGAGTGLLSALMLKKFPTANLTLIDISDKMMEVANSRFVGMNNVKYIVNDYTNYVFENKFDIVISALSIHHLTDAEKKVLYKNTFQNLREGGVFINADQILGNTMFLDSFYKNNWKSKVESTELPTKEIASAYERTKLDKMSTLEAQIGWLKEIGFSDVDCMYKYFNFVVIYGRKLKGFN